MLFRSKYELTVLVKNVNILLLRACVDRHEKPVPFQQIAYCEPRYGTLTKRDAAIMFVSKVSVRLINERPLVSIILHGISDMPLYSPPIYTLGQKFAGRIKQHSEHASSLKHSM